jgi:GNAT superfamily N-acetyltransferase
MTTLIRAAGLADASALADLRRAWRNEGQPTPDATAPADAAREAEAVAAWMRENAATHTALVAVDGERVVGMAWLARLARLPNPGQARRDHGDLQSVYVLPAYRDRGVGSALVAAVVDEARRRGMHHLTVRSGTRSETVYRRLGFAAYDLLLDLELDGRDG